MRFRAWVSAAILAAALGASAGAQEWRGGKSRVDGLVRNEKGEPIPGCTVALRWGKSGRGGPDLQTDAKGRWAIFGIVGGPWDIDFECPGYLPKKISVNLQESSRNPSVDIQLEPLPPEAAAAAGPAEQAILVGGKKISKETAEAIEAGNAAIAAQNWAAARESYEKALVELPDNSALLMRLAAACLGDGKKDDALRYAKSASEKAPEEPAPWQMIAQLELEKGDPDAGMAALDKLPPEKVPDPALYVNAGVLFSNKKRLPEAEAAYSKAIAIRPDATAHYYRGLARYQQKKLPEAKADFQKALELEPGGSDAQEIKDILKTIP